MTPLPQRKKTAEEISKLRDQLGIPASVDSSEESQASELKPTAPEVTTFEAASHTNAAESLPAPTYPGEAPLEPTHREGLPTRRRSAAELEEIQRREMLNQLNSEAPTNIKFMAAHPALLAFAYLLAAAGACIFWMEAYPWVVVASGSACSLILAGFIALRRPLSRHHAGFISAISMLVGVFATIHHFPQLQHAS